MKCLAPHRDSEIADLAEEVARDYFPDSEVSPLRILEDQQITVSFGSYENAFDGLLECKAGRFHVFCNLDRVELPDSARARFTLAHELGHYFIDEHRNALISGRAPAHNSFCEYESKLLVEQEADHFASHLLMPDVRFREVVLGQDIGLPGVLAACEVFHTSVTSSAIKYVKSDFFVSCVLKWNSEGWAWKWLSDTMYKIGYRKTIEVIADIPRNSATLALIEEREPRQGFLDSCSSASDWFPFIRQGSGRDVPVVEQAISLGRFGILTFLYPMEEEAS